MTLNYLCTCCSPSGRSTDHSSSSVNGDVSASASKSHTTLANGYICKDCSLHSHRTESLTTRSSSSSSSQAAEASTDALSFSSSPLTSIYSRDRSRRNKTGETDGNVIFQLPTSVPPHICTCKCWNYWCRKMKGQYLHVFIELWLWEYN